jgi:hypothetical protein
MKITGLTILAILSAGIFFFLGMNAGENYQLVDKTNYLIESLCLSYLSAYFFYFINVYIVERNERKSILPFVARNVFSIINNNHSIIKCLKLDPKLSLSKYPDQEEFKLLLKNINPTKNAPYYYKNQSWLFLFRNRRKSTLETIDKILLSGKHLDDELRRILLEMHSSLYLREDWAFNSDCFEEKSLEKYNLVFSEYFLLISELFGFYNKILSKYNTVKN